MAFTGYLKIDGIDGESKRAEHEGEIDAYGVHWKVSQSSSASTGSGRTRGRAQISSFTCMKWYDAASPYLALACMQGKAFDEIIFSARKDSGEAHLDYLTVTLTNCIVSLYEMTQGSAESDTDDMINETVSFSCESINVKYVVQADDHSAGDEHEIEYDIVAGA
ncbi:MAG: type VI secretion system tube protein Hcp [Paracoccaceae bacterium]|nr:type VI secretion system tube protein Hcp [Paracoccaceae bacterium]